MQDYRSTLPRKALSLMFLRSLHCWIAHEQQFAEKLEKKAGFIAKPGKSGKTTRQSDNRVGYSSPRRPGRDLPQLPLLEQ